MFKFLPACLKLRGLVAARLPAIPFQALSAYLLRIFGKIDRNFFNFSGTFLHNSGISRSGNISIFFYHHNQQYYVYYPLLRSIFLCAKPQTLQPSSTVDFTSLSSSWYIGFVRNLTWWFRVTWLTALCLRRCCRSFMSLYIWRKAWLLMSRCWLGPEMSCKGPKLQRWAKKWTCFAKQQPSRARQEIPAT